MIINNLTNYRSSYNKKCADVTCCSSKSENYFNNGKFLYQEGNFDEASAEYRKALEINPQYYEARFELAKCLKQQENYAAATEEFYKCLELDSKQTESQILIGECYIQQGLYGKAIDILSEVVKKEPKNDIANRNLKNAKNKLLFAYNPQKATNELSAVKRSTINSAYIKALTFLPVGFTYNLNNLKIDFDETEKMAGYSNIAQYEHSRNRITISSDYIWANPILVGAYLVHEFVHARDNDAYTSIREEQDAFRMQAEYWIKNNEGLSDSELDYVAKLYQNSPQTLADRVEEIYKLRDKNIAETSPNHPPDKDFKSNTSDTLYRIKYNAIA